MVHSQLTYASLQVQGLGCLQSRVWGAYNLGYGVQVGQTCCLLGEAGAWSGVGSTGHTGAWSGVRSTGHTGAWSGVGSTGHTGAWSGVGSTGQVDLTRDYPGV